MKSALLNSVFIFSLFLYGCSVNSPVPEEFSLDESISGKQMIIPPYSHFKLEMEIGIDAGLSWSYDISNNDCLRIDSVSYRSLSPYKSLGGPAMETFYFSTKKPGYTSIRMIHKQQWVKDQEPQKTVVFSVMVEYNRTHFFKLTPYDY